MTPWLPRSLFCKHEWEFGRNIYGDEIIRAGYRRSWWRCKKCGRYRLDPHLYPELEECAVDATQKSRRSDSLYYDHISRRELCDMIAHLESCVEELNAKLERCRKEAESEPA